MTNPNFSTVRHTRWRIHALTRTTVGFSSYLTIWWSFNFHLFTTNFKSVTRSCCCTRSCHMNRWNKVSNSYNVISPNFEVVSKHPLRAVICSVETSLYTEENSIKEATAYQQHLEGKSADFSFLYNLQNRISPHQERDKYILQPEACERAVGHPEKCIQNRCVSDTGIACFDNLTQKNLGLVLHNVHRRPLRALPWEWLWVHAIRNNHLELNWVPGRTTPLGAHTGNTCNTASRWRSEKSILRKYPRPLIWNRNRYA